MILNSQTNGQMGAKKETPTSRECYSCPECLGIGKTIENRRHDCRECNSTGWEDGIRPHIYEGPPNRNKKTSEDTFVVAKMIDTTEYRTSGKSIVPFAIPEGYRIIDIGELQVGDSFRIWSDRRVVSGFTIPNWKPFLVVEEKKMRNGNWRMTCRTRDDDDKDEYHLVYVWTELKDMWELGRLVALRRVETNRTPEECKKFVDHIQTHLDTDPELKGQTVVCEICDRPFDEIVGARFETT